MSIIALLTGVLGAIAAYLMMSQQLSRWLYSIILFSSMINICLLLSGRVYLATPAIITGMTPNMADPISQALILTAIVISFSFIAFALILLRTLIRQKQQDISKAMISHSSEEDKRAHE